MTQGTDLRVGGIQAAQTVKKFQNIEIDRLTGLNSQDQEASPVKNVDLINLRFDFEDRGLYRQASSIDSRLFLDYFKVLLKTKESKDHALRLTYLEGLKSWVYDELEKLDPTHHQYEDLKAIYTIFEEEFKQSERWFSLQRSVYE